MKDRSPPEQLSWYLNRAHPDHLSADFNEWHGYGQVADFHAGLSYERGRRGAAYSSSGAVRLARLPDWWVVQEAISRNLEPGLALDSAVFWGFVSPEEDE